MEKRRRHCERSEKKKGSGRSTEKFTTCFLQDGLERAENGQREEGEKFTRVSPIRTSAREGTTDEDEGYDSESTNAPNPDDWRAQMEGYARMVHEQIVSGEKQMHGITDYRGLMGRKP